mgnify:CR=1 FL=1
MFIIVAKVTLKDGEITRRAPRRYLKDLKQDLNGWSPHREEAFVFETRQAAESWFNLIAMDLGSAAEEPYELPLGWQTSDLMPEVAARPYRPGDRVDIMMVAEDGRFMVVAGVSL